MKQKLLSTRQGLALFLALLFFTSFAVPLHAETTKITFLHTNDMGELSAKEGFGGFPELLTLLKAERKSSPNSITTFGGDLISPSLMSSLSKGAEMIQMMNAIKIDLAVLGNHEFDFGSKITKSRVSESNFIWLGTNVIGIDGEPLAGTKTYLIKEIAGYKIGFFGLTTPETAFISSPGESIIFSDIITTARKSVANLKAKGADIIVALTHINLANDILLAKEVKGLHLILGGHDHRIFASVENGVTILQAGSDLRYLGVVNLSVERQEEHGNKYLSVIPSFKIITTAGVPSDPKTSRIVKGFEEKLDEKTNIAIGTTEIRLDTRRAFVRTEPAKFGELVALAMKQKVGSDFGFVNGGNIRGDREYAAKTVITRKDVLKELPFGNVIVLLEISGKNVQQLVEHSVSKIEDHTGRFGHYSGLNYDLDPNKDPGNRVSNININGVPLDPLRIYTIATSNYIAEGGNGFDMLALGKFIIDKYAGTPVGITVIDFILDNGGITSDIFE